MKVFLLFLFLISFSKVIIETKSGKIQGIIEDGIYSFKGIPYAEPPLRWKPPVPKRRWEGIFDASKFGFICPQNKNWGNQYPKQSEE